MQDGRTCSPGRRGNRPNSPDDDNSRVNRKAGMKSPKVGGAYVLSSGWGSGCGGPGGPGGVGEEEACLTSSAGDKLVGLVVANSSMYWSMSARGYLVGPEP